MSNIVRNCLRDVWYMTLTLLISVMRKYKILPLVATGRYSSRAVLILISVSAAVCNFWLTSTAVTLVMFSTLIRSSSSTREPCVDVRRYSRLSSNSFIFLLLLVTSSINLILSLSSSCKQQIHILIAFLHWADASSLFSYNGWATASIIVLLNEQDILLILHYLYL